MSTIRVKIKGHPFEGFERLALQGAAPVDPQGCPAAGKPPPFSAILHRDLAGAPGTEGFAWVTGEDGSLIPLELEIELYDSRGELSHTLVLKDAFLSSLTTEDEGTGSHEQWLVQAGYVSLTAAGENEVFDPKLELTSASN